MSSPVWYILRSFNCQELKVSQFLTEKGKHHFIPMMYVEKPDRKGNPRRVLAPVVHNLIFLEKDDSQRNLMQLLEECPVTCYALRKEDSSEWCEVPDPGRRRGQARQDGPCGPRSFHRHDGQAPSGEEQILLHQDPRRLRRDDTHFAVVL